MEKADPARPMQQYFRGGGDVMRISRHVVVVASIMMVASVSPVAIAQADEVMRGAHHGFGGVISKIESGMLFVKTQNNLQMRTISPNKADRVGLHEARKGETVLMLVDSGNVLLDVTRAGRAFADHRMIVGTLHYSDPYWSEIQLSTPEGFERFDVDALAGSKLSVFQEGVPVTVELDADNVMIDIQRSR
jgi:translation elongation factor P/translation initiation factor 5A